MKYCMKKSLTQETNEFNATSAEPHHLKFYVHSKFILTFSVEYFSVSDKNILWDVMAVTVKPHFPLTKKVQLSFVLYRSHEINSSITHTYVCPNVKT